MIYPIVFILIRRSIRSAAPSRVTNKKMNRKEADAFFGKLEEGLKENFTIPKRKLSSSPDKSAKTNKREASDSEQSTVAAEANSQDVTSPEKNEDEDTNALAFPKNTSPSKSSTASGYDRKPPGIIQTIICIWRQFSSQKTEGKTSAVQAQKFP